MPESKISRKVSEAYRRSKDQKTAIIEEPDVGLLGLDQNDCVLITGKRKASACWLNPYGSNHNGIGLDIIVRAAADVSIGDTVIIEKITPLAGKSVTLKILEEIIPGISSRTTEYIPFALKDNPLVIGERVEYSFDATPFVFEVLDIQPTDTGAIVVTKDTKFAIEPKS